MKNKSLLGIIQTVLFCPKLKHKKKIQDDISLGKVTVWIVPGKHLFFIEIT